MLWEYQNDIQQSEYIPYIGGTDHEGPFGYDCNEYTMPVNLHLSDDSQIRNTT